MKKGCDVSSHQANIDWGKVKADGIEFAIIRIGFGMYTNQKDTYFEQNYANAKANGIDVGVYTYSYAKTPQEAQKEAECVLGWLNGKQLDLPVYFDLEDDSQKNLGKSTLNAMCEAFCEKIKAGGYTPGIYANKYWSTSLFDGASLGQKYSFWVAQYNSTCTYGGKYDLWQYSSSGHVNGINGNCDMDYMYNQQGGGGGTTPTKPTCTGNITYKAYDNVKGQWLPSVTNDSDFAGNKGNTIGGIKAKCVNGDIYLQAHVIGKKYYEETVVMNASNFDSDSSDAYAGIKGKNIDLVKIWSDYGYVEYRVAPMGGNYYAWVKSTTKIGKNSYAGVAGKPIDRLQMR